MLDVSGPVPLTPVVSDLTVAAELELLSASAAAWRVKPDLSVRPLAGTQVAGHWYEVSRLASGDVFLWHYHSCSCVHNR